MKEARKGGGSGGDWVGDGVIGDDDAPELYEDPDEEEEEEE